MKIKIYQITRKKDKRNLSYTSYVFTQKHGGIDPAEYELVFDGDVGAKNLEDVFCLFNNYLFSRRIDRGILTSITINGFYRGDKRFNRRIRITKNLAL